MDIFIKFIISGDKSKLTHTVTKVETVLKTKDGITVDVIMNALEVVKTESKVQGE